MAYIDYEELTSDEAYLIVCLHLITDCHGVRSTRALLFGGILTAFSRLRQKIFYESRIPIKLGIVRSTKNLFALAILTRQKIQKVQKIKVGGRLPGGSEEWRERGSQTDQPAGAAPTRETTRDDDVVMANPFVRLNQENGQPTLDQES